MKLFYEFRQPLGVFPARRERFFRPQPFGYRRVRNSDGDRYLAHRPVERPTEIERVGVYCGVRHNLIMRRLGTLSRGILGIFETRGDRGVWWVLQGSIQGGQGFVGNFEKWGLWLSVGVVSAPPRPPPLGCHRGLWTPRGWVKFHGLNRGRKGDGWAQGDKGQPGQETNRRTKGRRTKDRGGDLEEFLGFIGLDEFIREKS